LAGKLIGKITGEGSELSTNPAGKCASTPTGQKGSPMNVPKGTNTNTVIGGRQYLGHALDEMQSEGITPSVVENTIKNGNWRLEGTDKVYYDPVNKIKVVTISETGAVKTVTSANNFKATAPNAGPINSPTNPGPINIPKYPP
jgi:hypothetical protein